MREVDPHPLAEHRMQRSGVERPDGQMIEAHVLEALLDHAGLLGRVPHGRQQTDGLVAEPAERDLQRRGRSGVDPPQVVRRDDKRRTLREHPEHLEKRKADSKRRRARCRRVRPTTGQPREPGAVGPARPARCRAAPAPTALTAPRTTTTPPPPPPGSSGLGRTGPAASRIAACHNTVLPMPAAPTRTSAAGPRSNAERNAPISRSSSSRPTTPTAIPDGEFASS